MKPLTLIETRTILALAENEFIPKLAAYDLGVSVGSIYTRMSRIREQQSMLFKFKRLTRRRNLYPAVTGFTENGYRFYEAAKYFIDCLDEIESDIMEIK